MAGRKGVLFDTSTWSPVDLLDFYRQIPPEQVVYASDYPYGQQPSSLLIALRTAQLAGYSDDQLRAMLAGTANALADGRELPEPTTPLGTDTFAQPLQLARIHQYLSMTTPLLWSRQPDTIGDARPRDQHLRRAQRPRRVGRPDPRAARSPRATSGRRCPAIEDEAQRRVRDRG